MAFLFKIPRSIPIFVKSPDKSPSLSPERVLVIEKKYSCENYEENPDFQLVLKKIVSQIESEEKKSLHQDEIEESNNNENNDKIQSNRSNDLQINDPPPTSSQELKFQSETDETLKTETNLLFSNPGNRKNVRGKLIKQDSLKKDKITELLEKKKKDEDDDEEDKEKIKKMKAFVRRKDKKKKTSYRDFNEYKNLWIFLPDDYFKQRWDILIMTFFIYYSFNFL